MTECLSMTRSRKHPLGLTLLSQNYKQLLDEFHEFQGVRKGSNSSSSSIHGDGENCSDSNPCTPPSGQIEPAQAIIHDSTASQCRGQGAAAEGGQTPCLTSSQHAPVGTVVPQAAPQATVGSSKRPHSSKTPTCTPPKQRTPATSGSAHGWADASQQQASPATPRTAAARLPAPRSSSAKAQSSSPSRRALQLKQLQHSSRRLHAAIQGDAAAHDAGDFSALQEAPDALAKPHTTAAAGGTPVDKPSLRQHRRAPSGAPASSTACASQHTAAAVASAGAAAAASSEGQQASATADLRETQSPLWQQQQHKRSRRRVGDNSLLTTSNTCSSSVAAASSSAAAGSATAGAAVPGVFAQPTAAVSSRPHVELPRLPLQHLHAGAGLLPPVHPLSSRGPQLSAGSAQTSKSEPASARISRRTSDSSSEAGSADGGGSSSRRGDSSVLAGASTVRHHSLPEALPHNRLHSIACLVDVARRQRPRPQAVSEGGQSPCADAGSNNLRLQPLQPLQHSQQQHPQQQQQPQQQPSQPLKQLQELRRRGQLRAGADAGSSHDYQILVLEGPASTFYSSKQGSGDTSRPQHKEPWEATATAAAAAGGGGSGPDRPWPSLAADVTPAAGPTAHRRTRSSNTQLPPLDERAVLASSALPQTLLQQQQQQPGAAAGRGGASIPLLTAAAAAGGDVSSAVSGESSSSSGFLSRRSSSDSSAAGFVCEPSSFGVCADPAGAVHLVAPAIPDKLTRLKQRLPSRVTADSVAAAAAAAARRNTAEAAVQAASGASLAAEAAAGGASSLLADKQTGGGTPTAPAAGKKGRIRARWVLPLTTQQQQQQGDDNELPLQAPAADASNKQQHALLASQQQQQQQQCASVLGGPQGAGPGLGHPHAEAAQHMMAPTAAAAGQQRQQAPPAPQQQWPQQRLPPQQPMQPLQQPQIQQPLQQQQQQVGSLLSDLKQQLEHWACWVQLHCHNPQQVPPPPQLPPQLQVALMQQEQYTQQHQQYLQPFQQQQQQHTQQQQYAPQQQYTQQQYVQQQQYALQQPAWRAAATVAATAAVPGAPANQQGQLMGTVPAHGALSRYTDPLAAKQHQRLLEQLQGMLQPAGDAARLAAAPECSLQQQQGASWQGLQQQQGFAGQGPQQQQGCAGQVPDSPPPPVVSAAALAQQRQVMMQEAFEGLSLEAVLASAKKTKPPSRRQLMQKAGSTAEAAG